ncbi:MAG: ATPase, T2SS/T4P/T4SS family [Candidatus Omnitrophota bacterium]|jgi:septum site-determining protein MinD|nr:ATPase, T2SS/T4P/T4SS family [Candidatus Omnitrophota bacterium]MDD5518788.1 ATPase, T2SS/T4P/T4SS family [Candidatus Omnitrophota bacterium]
MSRKIVIFSTKGGVGKTLISTNLACSLAKEQGQKVCLMDLDLQAVGDMARMLDLKVDRSMVEFIQSLKKQPAEFKSSDFLIHSYMGLDLLCGVTKPQQAPHLKPENIKEIFNLLDKDYDYMIVDAGKSLSDLLLATLNQANLIILVVTPDILSIYQAEWAIDTLQSLQFPLSMIKVILNRAESISSISLQEIKVNLLCGILHQIPSEGRVVGLAVNRGIPVVIDSPRSRFSLAMNKLSEQLVRDKDLFTDNREIDQLRLQHVVVERPAKLWEEEGLTEPVIEELSAKEERADDIIILKRKIHSRLIDELNIKRLDLKVFSDTKKSKSLRSKAEVLVSNFLVEEAGTFISSPEVRKKLVREILDEALGLGPLDELLAMPDITDIMVNNKDEIYIERRGKIELTSKKFISNEQVKTTIERIIAPIGKRVDESVPMVDARLADGSRVNAIIPPLALTGPSLTIRKFRKEKFKIEDLVQLKAISPNMAEFIGACVICRKNIIVSGGTGSGKTTVLNILSGFIPENERIITIEDAAELKLDQQHWVRLESRSPNIEGRGAVTIRDLFRNTLRMRPDRIIIGECRGIEALDMLQAMNTGHDGSMTTIHANSTQDVLSRLDSMILMGGVELPIRAIREMIASAIDLIIHTARLSDGSRKIIQVTEVSGMRDELHINLKDIFTFKQTGIDAQGNVLGAFQATGYIPPVIEEIRIKGIKLSDSIFQAPG